MILMVYLKKRQFLAGFRYYFDENSGKMLFLRDLFIRKHTDLNPFKLFIGTYPESKKSVMSSRPLMVIEISSDSESESIEHVRVIFDPSSSFNIHLILSSKPTPK